MDKLIGLFPVDPKLETFLVCDANYLVTGACLFQKDDNGQKLQQVHAYSSLAVLGRQSLIYSLIWSSYKNP